MATLPSVNPAVNPSVAPATRMSEADRIPLSVPQLRLAVPDVPGYHLHWFVTKNVARALRAGYTFVEQDEVEINNPDISGAVNASGSTDLGSRVSLPAGGFIEGTSEVDRLFLMKLPKEWRDKDVAKLEAINDNVAAALRGGRTPAGGTGAGPAETPLDQTRRYLKTGQDLFYPKVRRPQS
jgi:hypothetical protein